MNRYPRHEAGDRPASALIRISTEMFPGKERFSAFREEYVRRRMAIDMVDRSDGSPHAEITVMPLGPADFVSFRTTPMEAIRDQRHLKSGRGDTFTLALVRSGRFRFEQAGHEQVAEPGSGVFCDHGRPWRGTGAGNLDLIQVTISAAALRTLVCDPEDLAARPLDGGPLVRLLEGYMASLSALDEAPPPGLARTMGGHLLDLVAAVLGPCREAADVVEGRGARAARLRAVLELISQRFAKPAFDLAAAAEATGLSRRYVQDLLEDTGKPFTEHVLERRLERALTLLRDPRSGHLPIIDIAFNAGFGDISYFNRMFRRRFGDTPTGMRAGASQPDAASRDRAPAPRIAVLPRLLTPPFRSPAVPRAAAPPRAGRCPAAGAAVRST